MPTFDIAINELRKQIKEFAGQVLNHKNSRNSNVQDVNENRGEVMANLTLSYRHLEDASMRLGKVLQHLNGGVSHYDHNVVGDPTTADEGGVNLTTETPKNI